MVPGFRLASTEAPKKANKTGHHVNTFCSLLWIGGFSFREGYES